MLPLLNIAMNAARQAADVIIRHAPQIEHLKITEKGPNDYCSEVDLKAEQVIINTILKAYPEHGIIAEESGVHRENAEVVWIIDPLDGTGNYLHGFPFYAVSIAIRVKNRIEYAVIYDPLRHECFSASHGGGARLEDRRIRVSKRTQLARAMLTTGFPKHDTPVARRALTAFEKLWQQSPSVRRIGSAALSLAYVACGRCDGFWGFDLPIWDLAAGTLLVQEAGGFVGHLEGGEEHDSSRHLIAATPKIFKPLQEILSSHSG